MTSVGLTEKERTLKSALSTLPSHPKSSIEISEEDQGHRVGNFHNYYSFHPPQNRLTVMKECGILDFIADRIITRTRSYTFGDKNISSTENERVVKRVKYNDYVDENKKSPRGNFKTHQSHHFDLQEVNYCDLGCNEGDLSIAFTNLLSKTCNGKHPGNNNIKMRWRCLGLDIDPNLIARASRKKSNTILPSDNDDSITLGRDVLSFDAKKELSGSCTNIELKFQVCNLCDDEEQRYKCNSFLEEEPCTSDDGSIIQEKGKYGSVPMTAVKRFDLITIFSTTMWIHVHSGDEGLKNFLKRTCDLTDMLLVEPQPSKCYRSVNVRLRKMNRPELDITSDRLKMRLHVEEEVESVVRGCGFEKVSTTSADSCCGNIVEGKVIVPKKSVRTAWKRSLQLYARCPKED